MTIAKIKFKMGECEYEFSTPDMTQKDAFAEITFFSDLKATFQRCGLCGSEDVKIFHRNPQGNSYFGVSCNKCGADVNIGQHKNTPTLFVKKDAPWSIWDGQPKNNSASNQAGNSNTLYNAPPAGQTQVNGQAPQNYVNPNAGTPPTTVNPYVNPNAPR